jgi:hypothetical protein
MPVPRSRQRALVPESARLPRRRVRHDVRRGHVRVRSAPPTGCDDDCPGCPENFEPRTILEISDCSERIELRFETDSKRRRANSLHKLDTLIAALRVFRKGLEEEFVEYDRRQQS